jgi:hypothetical protein
MDMLIRPGPCRRSAPVPQTVKIQPCDEKPAPDLLACRYRGRSWGRARRPADRSIIKLRKPAPRSSTPQPKIVLPTRTWACLEEPVKTEDTSIDRQPHVKKCPLPRNGERTSKDSAARHVSAPLPSDGPSTPRMPRLEADVPCRGVAQACQASIDLIGRDPAGCHHSVTNHAYRELSDPNAAR